MDLDVRVQGIELPLMRFQVFGGVVADEDGFGAVVGELVRRCAPDADGAVGAGYDYYFVFDATVKVLVSLRW